MKKFFISLVSTILSSLILFSFAGCTEKEDVGLHGGFGADGDPVSPIKVAFSSDRSIIPIGTDLEIKLFYGSLGGYGSHSPAPINVSATVIMRSWLYEDDYQSPILLKEQVIREIDDFANDSYKWGSNLQQNATAGIEAIVIPNDWFVGNEGGISWNVSALIVFPSDSPLKEQSEDGGISLYYIKQDKDIILFDNYYDFFNYERK